VHPLFLSEAVESAKRPHTLYESKALNMGIAELEPRHKCSPRRIDTVGEIIPFGVDVAVDLKVNQR
jgi:hypothetical protein